MPFPKSKEGINTLLQTWKTNIELIESTFGITGDQKKEIAAMANNYNYIFDFFQQFDGDVKAAYKFKTATETGVKANQGNPVYPTFEAFALPNDVIFDIEGKAKAYRKSFRNNLAYNDAIGEVLLIAESPKPPTPESISPVLKPEPTGEYAVSVAYDRKGQGGVTLQYQFSGETKWNNVPSPGAKSPIIFTITPPADAENQPVTIKLRGRYYNGNSPAGVWSPEYTVYVQPD